MAAPAAPLHPWKWPTCPWACLHVVYADPISDSILVIIYRCTLEVDGVSFGDIQGKLQILFTQFTHSGTCFGSEDFEAFLRENGIEHYMLALYYIPSLKWAHRANYTNCIENNTGKSGDPASYSSVCLYIILDDTRTTGYHRIAHAELLNQT